MAALPQFKQRQLARRSTSDLDQLAKQYKTSIAQAAGGYEKSFGDYQSATAEKMKPFEAGMETYKSSLPTYEAQKADYQKKLDDYNLVLEGIAADPVTAVTAYRTVPRGGLAGKLGRTRQEAYTDYIPKEIPRFTDVAPTAPVLPVAPEIGAFDASAFDAQRAGAEGVFKREVGERRAAKIGAVSRKAARPLLSGAA